MVVTEVDGAAGDGVGEVAGGGVGVVEHRGEGGAQGRDGLLHLPSHASAAAKRWGRRRRVRIWGNGGFPFASFKTILARGRGQKKNAVSGTWARARACHAKSQCQPLNKFGLRPTEPGLNLPLMPYVSWA